MGHDTDRCGEPVSASWQRLDVNKVACRVSQRLAHSPDGGVQSVVEVDKGVFRPDLSTQLVSFDDGSRILQESGEHLEWLTLNPNWGAVLSEHTTFEVNLKWPELHHSSGNYTALIRIVGNDAGRKAGVNATAGKL